MSNNNLGGKAVVLGANLIAGCLKGGIASAIDGRGFWSACGKGAVGGAVAFSGEYVASYNNYPFVGGAGKLIHDLGISMSDNIMRGEGFFSQFQTDVGPVNLTFRSSYVPKVTFTLRPIYGIGCALLKKHRFDLKNSVYNLTPIFSMPQFQETYSIRGDTLYVGGHTVGNVIEYAAPLEVRPYILPHEMNHALFWRKLRFTDDFFHRLSDNKLLQWWDMSQDLYSWISSWPYFYSASWYLYDPIELEADTMGP